MRRTLTHKDQFKTGFFIGPNTEGKVLERWQRLAQEDDAASLLKEWRDLHAALLKAAHEDGFLFFLYIKYRPNRLGPFDTSCCPWTFAHRASEPPWIRAT